MNAFTVATAVLIVVLFAIAIVGSRTGIPTDLASGRNDDEIEDTVRWAPGADYERRDSDRG